MRKDKAPRYYRIENGMLCIYDNPYPSKSWSVSIVGMDQLPYYRNTFALSKVWGE